jgi:hypothetical protein
MVTISKKLNLTTKEKPCKLSLYKSVRLEKTIKKGLTTFDSCKPFVYMVGGTGFEPVTSTV